MNISVIKAVQKHYRENGGHKETMKKFGLNKAQEYAINILGRDNNFSAEKIYSKIHLVEAGMNVGQIAAVYNVEVSV